MKYQVGFLGTGGGGSTSLSYTHSWGVGGEESKQITLGSTSGVSVTLQPGQSVLSELSASRGEMKIRVVYRAHLIGRTAVNYNPKFNGHHFYALPIDSVMSSGGISNSVRKTEDISVGYFSNGKIEVKDLVSQELVHCIGTDETFHA